MASQVLRFFPSDVSVSLGPQGAHIQLAEGVLSADPGAPALPGRLLHVALEPGRRPTGVTATLLSEQVLLQGPTLVKPHPRLGVGQLAVQAPAAPRFEAVPPNEALYAAARTLPLAELRGYTDLGGVPVALVFVRPLRLTEGDAVHLVTSLRLSIRTASRSDDLRATLHLGPRAQALRHIAASLAYNIEDVPSNDLSPEGAGGGGGATGSAGGATTDLPLPTLAAVPDRGPRVVDYLILTNTHAWNTEDLSGVSSYADVQAMWGMADASILTELQPLIAHKAGRGLRTHVVTVDEILRGDYGDHRAGARDIPEAIRRFLQAYVRSRQVEWLLICGDPNFVPMRRACGSGLHGVFGAATGVGGEVVPKVGEYSWKGSYLAMRLADDVATNTGQIGQPDHILTMQRTGRRVPKVAAPTGTALCWFYTDSTWTTASATPTPYARVNGPASIIQDEPQWYTPDNLIPTDLYYSSLYGPNDLQPGKHDWDLLGQGLYGQWSRTMNAAGGWTSQTNLGGADYTPDVSVGRVPTRGGTDVATFVAKLIRYETAEQRATEHDRFRRLLLVAEHWSYDVIGVGRQAGDPQPPADGTYSYEAFHSRSLIHASGLKAGRARALLAYSPSGAYSKLSYDASGARGWHYAVSATDLSPSQIRLPVPYLAVDIPIPTEWAVVHSTASADLTPELYFFEPGDDLDGSIVDVEALRAYMKGAHPAISDVQRIYSDEEDLSAEAAAAAPVQHLSAARVESALNAGPHLVALSGHGNWWGCCGVNYLTAARLTNGDGTFIAYADSCNTAMLDTVNNLAQDLVTRAGGAVAYVGNTRWSWIGIGKDLQLDFFRQLRVQRHVGLMVDAGRRLSSAGPNYRWAAMTLHLVGCPEMPVYRDPSDAQVRYIGNLGSRELHERFCPWVKRMSLRNMRTFLDKSQALSMGYDGCGFCMREHHTR